MDQNFKPGDLVFLTKWYEDFVREKNPKLEVFLVNRLSKIEEIIDWESDIGKAIKEERIASSKWTDLPIEDNKYILSVYYHELIGRNGEQGVIQRGVPMFQKNPKTGKDFFMKAPSGIFKEIAKECEKLGYGMV